MNEANVQRRPADRSAVLTEQRNPRTMRLHEMSVAEIVETIRREDHAVLAAMEKAAPSLTALIADAEPRFTAGGRLIYLGAGTSGRLGVLDASEAPPTFQVDPGRVVGMIAGGDSALRKSSESKEDDPHGAAAELDALKLTSNDTVIGIAAGGSTPYVIGALDHAANVAPGSLRALMVCSPREKPVSAHHLIVLETGPEVLTGSTRMKAGTATKLALNTISTTLMIRSGRVFENLMVDMRASNEKLRDRAARIVATLTGLTREESFDLLEQAGGEVKTAVIMQRRGVPRDEALELLRGAGGMLHRALKGREA